MNPQQFNVQRAFRERMYREGRGGEFEKCLDEEVAECGNVFGAKGRAIWKVMKRMGYRNSAEEKKFWQEHLNSQNAVEEATRIHENACEILDALEKIPNLPAAAPPAVELEWVGGHPAILRRSLQRNKSEEAVITEEDILQAPHGLPPSRRAVNRLAHWANNVDEFQKQELSVHKKAEFVGKDRQAAEESDNDLSLKEVRDLLGSLAKK